MASISKRKNKDGTSHWRAVVRIKGYPTVCNHFDRKQEADDWAAEIERQIKHGQFKFDQHNNSYICRLNRPLSKRWRLGAHPLGRRLIRHLEYWKSRLGDFALVHLTTDLIGKERQLLADTPTNKNAKRTSSTVNRYIASLSAILSYAVQLRWIERKSLL